MQPILFSVHRRFAWLPMPAQRAARDALVRYRYLDVGPNDLVLAGYPKSGTTFLRFVLAHALTTSEVDFNTVRDVTRSIGAQRGLPRVVPGGGRLIKSHELPKLRGGARAPKVLYLVRDGRDVGVSYYHDFVRRGEETGDLESFMAHYTAGLAGPYGSWQNHVRTWREFSAQSPQPSAVIRYEDMLADPLTALLKASQTLDLGLTPERAEAAIEANKPAKMRAKESGSDLLNANNRVQMSFVREAKAGGWRGSLDAPSAREFERLAAGELREFGYDVGETPHTGG